MDFNFIKLSGDKLESLVDGETASLVDGEAGGWTLPEKISLDGGGGVCLLSTGLIIAE